MESKFSKIPKPAFIKKPTEMKDSLPGITRLPLSDLLNIPEDKDIPKKRASSPDVMNVAPVHRAKLRRSRSASDLSRQNFHRPKFVSKLDAIPSTKSAPNYAAVTQMLKSNLVKQVSKPTLRRSVSTGDIAMKTAGRPDLVQSQLKRHMPTNNIGIPPKTTKLNTGSAVTAKVVPKKMIPPVTRKPIVSNKPKIEVAKTVSVNSSVSSAMDASKASSTGGAAKKFANKRIPPYDYKARFADLTERHKELKDKFEALRQTNSDLETLPQKYDDCLNELNHLKSEHDKLQKEHYSIVAENENLKLKNTSLLSSLTETESELRALKKQYTEADSERLKLRQLIITLEENVSSLKQQNDHLLLDNEKKSDLLFKANLERKDLHNTVMDLRGNIRVFCRVRPPLSSEADRPECIWKFLDEQSLEIGVPDLSNKRMEFNFDQVFHSRASQQDVFENVAPMIQSALDGYNVCIFAYGQTGSGKTFTMDGVADHLGVIPRTVDLIFNAIEDYKRFGWEYELRATFLEIYNEILYDLLDSSGTTKELDIRMANAKNKNEIYVSNIIEETVRSKHQLLELMMVAKSNRATAATVGNERSSRSHAVTKLTLIGTHHEKEEVSMGSINLVDLAGSESPKTSTRMDETKNINRSLSELGNVILALVQKNDHVPYRNSKLTHLLMPSLGGNSKTLMFVNVAPFQDCYNETVKSLRFASQVNSCQLQKVRKNKMHNSSSTF